LAQAAFALPLHSRGCQPVQGASGDVPALTFSGPAKAVAGALALAILILGAYPKPLQNVLTRKSPETKVVAQ